MAYSIGDYPLPSFAAYIWTDGQDIILGLPPAEGYDRGHQLRIPLAKCGIEYSEWGTPKASQLGWKVIRDILSERSRAGSRDRFTVATPADPTQYIIERALRSGGAGVKRYSANGSREFTIADIASGEDDPSMMPSAGDVAR